MESVKVIASGIQPFNRDALAIGPNIFIYTSTLGLYILHPETLALKKVLSVTNKPYTAVSCTSDNIVAVTAENNFLVVSFDGRVLFEAKNFANALPLFVEVSDTNDVFVGLGNGDVFSVSTVRPCLDRKMFAVGEAEIAALRAHAGRVLVGTRRGDVSCVEISSGKVVGTWKLGKLGEVVDLQFDTLSSEFFLVASETGLGLYEVKSEICLTNFQHPGKATQIQWLPSMPGNFLSASASRPGVLLLWNARRGASPLAELRVGSLEICSFRASRNSGLVFFGQANGAVGVYDVQTRSLLRTTAPGHTETVFDCCFDVEDPDILATASYDGRVKLWRLCDASMLREFFAGKEHQLYGLSVAKERLAACSSSGVVFVWNKHRGDLISSCKAHDGIAIRVKLDVTGQVAASGGLDGYCAVLQTTAGVVLHKLKHPAAVFGCLFKSDKEILTACEDGIIRIWRIPRSDGAGRPEIMQEFRGHKEKVFNLAVSPLLPKYFASSSDDMCVNIWDFQAPSENSLVARLAGHKSVVRAIEWHPEIARIIFSGSWDCSVRVWDFTKGECVLVVGNAHQADVYGLSIHPMRPFLIVSCSRDSTIKLWDVHKALVGNLADELLEDPSKTKTSPQIADAAEGQGLGLLWGECSKKAFRSIGADKHEDLKSIADLFIWREGISDLWAAARREKKDDFVVHCHETHLLSTEISRANNRAAMASDGSSSRLIGGVANTAAKRDQIFIQAATDLARAGNFSGACECFIAASEWLKALALAPAVSLEYWQKVLTRYNDQLDLMNTTCNIDEVASLAAAAGRYLPLAHAYLAKNHHQKAIVAVLAGNCPVSAKSEIADKIVAKYLETGEVVKAAACLASFDGRQTDAIRLLRAWGENTIASVLEKILL